MAAPSNAPGMEYLDFMYDFDAREFIFGFEHKHQAVTYRNLISEARISDRQPSSVRLPRVRDIIGLRSSSLGMVAMFDSREAAQRWRKHTVIGDLATFDGNQYGVYFQRKWIARELERLFDRKMQSSRESQNPGRIHFNPRSSERNFSINYGEIEAERQCASVSPHEDRWYHNYKTRA